MERWVGQPHSAGTSRVLVPQQVAARRFGNPRPFPSNPKPRTRPSAERPKIDHDCDISMPGDTSIGKGQKGDKGDKGDRGEKGEKGDPGADGKSITAEEVAAIIVQVLEADPDRFRGPQGPPGDAANVDIDAITKQVRANLQFDVVYPDLYGGSPQQATVDFSQGKPRLTLPDTSVTIRDLDNRLRRLEDENNRKNGRETQGT